MATKLEKTDVSLAVLYLALRDAIDPLWDSVCECFDDIYNVTDGDKAACADYPYTVADKLGLAADVAAEFELRSKDREAA